MAIIKPNNNTISAITALPAAIPTGKVLQVKYTSIATEQTVVNAFDVDVTGLSVTITPTSSSSKFLITSSVQARNNDNTGYGIQIVKTVGGSSSTIFAENSVNTENRFNTYINSSDSGIQLRSRKSIQYLDSPSTSSEIVYKIQVDTDNSVILQTEDSAAYISVIEVSSWWLKKQY